MKLKSKNVILNPIQEDDINYIHSITSDFSFLAPTFPSYVRSKAYWEKRFADNGLWENEYGMLKMLCSSD